MPSYFYTHAALAAAYGHLGETESARNALRKLLAQKPDFARIAREELGKWNEPELVERFLDGLRKAGLDVPLPAARRERARAARGPKQTRPGRNPYCLL
jgi:hypothetical protein